MALSQNLRFNASIPADPEERNGASLQIALGLVEYLRYHEWPVAQPQDWRDCGWSLRCERHGSKVDITIAEFEPGEWVLQIAPTSSPGFIGKLFGGKVSASDGDMFDLALAVHQSLSTLADFKNPRWCWDAFPDEENSTPLPTKAEN